MKRSAYAGAMAIACLALHARVAMGASATGCETLIQSAATGAAAQMKADDTTIHQPQSVTQFTCLGNFFNGAGLDVLTNGLNVASIAQATMGKVCSELTSVWQNLEGAAQCGLTVTGLDNNFDLGLGAGAFCPSLNFGGGGDALISTATNTSGDSSWDVTGDSQLPDGYSLQLAGTSSGISEITQ